MHALQIVFPTAECILVISSKLITLIRRYKCEHYYVSSLSLADSMAAGFLDNLLTSWHFNATDLLSRIDSRIIQ
jgi:hypothetical protein